MLVELEVWLTKEDTHPELIPILIASIRSWLMDPYGDEPTFVWPTVLVSEAIIAQQQLGWYAFLMGCIAKPIVSLQNSYYIVTHSRYGIGEYVRQNCQFLQRKITPTFLDMLQRYM